MLTIKKILRNPKGTEWEDTLSVYVTGYDQATPGFNPYSIGSSSGRRGKPQATEYKHFIFKFTFLIILNFNMSKNIFCFFQVFMRKHNNFINNPLTLHFTCSKIN